MSAERAGRAWGRRAWDWAVYQEPVADNLYEAVLTALDVRVGVRLLDIACGSGLAVQRAVARGADGTGVDASPGLLDIARQRVPTARWLVSGMAVIPVDDGAFDVVTSFNGLQFGGAEAMHEAARVLRSGGRLGAGFWQDPGDFDPLFAAVGALAPPPAGSPSPMGFAEPGVVEQVMADAGLRVEERVSVPCVALYRTREQAVLGFGSSGPAVMAEEQLGIDAVRAALDEALAPHVDPDSGSVRMVGLMAYAIATKP